MPAFHDFTADSLAGEPQQLSDYHGKVVLVVNTASQCGFTPQYAGLEKLWESYRDAGLVVLGFPCNQFGGQEPGDAATIGDFCEKNYGVSFPMFGKVDVNGPDSHPLFGLVAVGGRRSARQQDQVELHQVPDRPGRRRDQAVRIDHQAGEDRFRYRGRAALPSLWPWCAAPAPDRLRSAPTSAGCSGFGRAAPRRRTA